MRVRLAVLAALLATSVSCREKSKGAGAPFTIVTGTAVLRAGDPLPRTSPIFADGKVTLRAVRGETLAVVIAFAGEARSHTVSTDLETELGPGIGVSLFAVEMVPVIEPSSALFGPSRGRGAYPDRLVELGGDRAVAPVSQILIDVQIDPGAAAGARQATLMIDSVKVRLELDVMPHSIELSRAPLVWAWYRAENIKNVEIEIEHKAVFLAHGVLLATDAAPGELQSRANLMLESALYWPVRIRSNDPQTLAANTRKVVEFFATRSATPFTIPIDEPPDDDARRRVVANGRAIHAAGGGPGKLLHAVTDHRRPIYNDSVDVFISPANVRSDNPAPKLRWTYNGRPPSAGNMTIDSQGGSLRSWGWIAFRYSVELWYAWHALYHTDRYNGAREPTDLSTSMLTFDQRRDGGDGGGSDYGNGDGLLLYPGGQPSLRLKALRCGLLDRLLLAKLVACGGEEKAHSIARATVPRALGEAEGIALWPSDEHGWEVSRSAVLDSIALRCPAE